MRNGKNMKNALRLLALAAMSAAGLAARGQGGGTPPRVESITWQVADYIGDRDFAWDEFTCVSWFYSRYASWDFWSAPAEFDPNTDVARELDAVLVEMVVVDDDLAEQDPNQQAQQDEEFFYRADAYGSDGPPPAPSLCGTTDRLYIQIEQPPPDPNSPNNARLMRFQLWVPRILGPNQERLRGKVTWDVRWTVQVRVANSDNPNVGEWDSVPFTLSAKQNARLLPPNPPPYADAGADRLVAKGSQVRLDGSRSFDSSNLGFDPNNPAVFEKDRLEYAWEWISGPEQVAIAEDPNAPGGPYALVTLNTVSPDNNPFVFRLLVSDGTNSPPSTDTVRIWVVESIPPNRAPTAVILDGAGQRLDLSVPVQAKVGDVLIFRALAGPDGADPDKDTLTYRWRQTNAVGGALMADEVASGYQPLRGVEQQEATWKAPLDGTYYFMLTVSDPAGLSHAALVTVDVAEAPAGSSASGTQSPRTRDISGYLAENQRVEDQPTSGGLCGAGGLATLAVVPFGLGLLRQRRR
jgi:hypothetical protein